MWNIATFNTFIAQDILIFFYYFCAVLVPFFLWRLRFTLLKKFFFVQKIESNIVNIYHSLTFKQKLITATVLVVTFFCMELCLRIMFEVMIGYFDMHDYLYEISRELRQK